MESNKKYYLADLSFIDYPERISDLLYVKSCNFTCKYCYNRKTLNTIPKEKFYNKEEVIEKISRGKLSNALTITGGEPSTVDVNEIKEIITALKNNRSDYKIKIDTNGSNLEFVKEIISFVDLLAIDIKGNEEIYKAISGNEEAYSVLKNTIKYLYSQDIRVIYRFIYYPEYFEDIKKSVDFLSKYFNKEKMSYSFNEYRSYGLLEEIEIDKDKKIEAETFLKNKLGG